MDNFFYTSRHKNLQQEISILMIMPNNKKHANHKRNKISKFEDGFTLIFVCSIS